MVFFDSISQWIFSKAPARVPLNAEGLINYSGRWLQLGASALVFRTFERGGSCANAFYDRIEDYGEGLKFRVRNAQVVGQKLEGITGEAFVADPDKASEIKVKFDTGFPIDIDMANYLIVGLGPVWESNDPLYTSGYEWSVVTDPLRLFSFVLGRYPEAYKVNQETIDEVIKSAQLDGKFLKNSLRFEDFSDCPDDPYAIPVIPESYDWEQYVGQAGEDAKKQLEEEFLWLDVYVVGENDPVTSDYRLDRVRLYVDDNGIIVKTPNVG